MSVSEQTQSLGGSFSLFEDNIELVQKSPSRILDPSVIVTLPPHSILESLARRLMSKVCCQLTGGEDAWDDLEVSSIDAETLRKISTSFGATHDSSPSVDYGRSLMLANKIKKIVAWYFCKENTRLRAPGWKLEREIEYILATCEKAIPQKRRLEHVLMPKENDQAFGQAGQLQAARAEIRQKLEAAEALAFKACVLHAISKRIFYPIPFEQFVPVPGEEEDSLQELEEVASLYYQTASLQEKIGMTNRQQQRVKIMLECWKIAPGLKTGFMTEVLNEWLHLIALYGKLPKVAQGIKMPDWVGEEVPDLGEMGISAELRSHVLQRMMFAASILHPPGPRSLRSLDEDMEEARCRLCGQLVCNCILYS